MPEHLRRAGGGLVYLSLGSLGSADVELMQRLVDVMGRTRHGVIVSKGPLADQIRLHDNMVGEDVLPQPAILPQVDVVITHGGNNTVTECFHNGKPMVVLPLFWDQVDNAQRARRDRLRRPPVDLWLRGRRAHRRRRSAPRRRAAPRSHGSRCRAAPGTSRHRQGGGAHRAGGAYGPADLALTTTPPAHVPAKSPFGGGSARSCHLRAPHLRRKAAPLSVKTSLGAAPPPLNWSSSLSWGA